MTRFLRAWLNRRLGDAGERASARFLRRKGLRIITRGYRTALGEIDLDNSVECNGYFSQPQTTHVRPEHDHAALTREDQRIGLV